ncbi:hypothetical protein [Streptomyces sp. NPDC057682]|uniref:hypothetical protein n=1 Tax=Streptomyces sp. NPDC057682 TaxID=3346210 RepID=UPI0036C0FB0C
MSVNTHLIRLARLLAPAAAVLALTGAAHAAPAGPPSPLTPCAGTVAPFGYVCVPSPKQCFTTPCPQYAFVPVLPGRRTEPGPA